MNAEHPSLRERARVHAALGDPARLAIVDTLASSDAGPGEIARALGMATNLVAHHLRVLTAAGLVTRVRSEGDRRRSYLRLNADVLAGLDPPRLPQPSRVVFVCTHNSARSQLAAALWRRRTGRPGASAGTRPAARVHPRAVAVARRHGLSLDPAGTAHLADIGAAGIDRIGIAGDLVIAVCDSAYEDLTHPAAGAVRPRLHWSVPDPVRVDTDAAFEAAYADLADRVDRLAPSLIPAPGRGAGHA